MRFQGKHYRTVWMRRASVFLIDQNLLPFKFKIFNSPDYKTTCHAIKIMMARGAGAIGAAAGFAMAQAFLQKANIEKARKEIKSTRPTAQNLFYAVERVFNASNPVKEAQIIADEDVANCRKIGEHGEKLIKSGSRIETHCNAGWLAFVDYGTALSPIYLAKKKGKKCFVYVDETRPRGQGARLTAWELAGEKIPFKIIPDNAGAFLMSRGEIDLMIVGADRIAANGDAANKIGTLEKAIAAKEFGIPFYVAAPTSTIDLNCKSGKAIPIEERSEDEVLFQTGLNSKSETEKVLVCSPGAKAFNPAFDVTPAKYITGMITEKGIVTPTVAGIKSLTR
ncbi:MAG: S-methyl-5-thioribose-1-phosphate isomerase [Candidatus Margulisbacteria bacterium]|nr:S-methyl-5-thioribose-1-phosphate isomerase [Candidatus Margulisiibacteriota bacterium]